MNILMVAPHPVYTPRGTPISVFNRCRVLCALGHTVTLVTYPIGSSPSVKGLTYQRARVPFIREVKVGPSTTKGVLDLAVGARSVHEVLRRRRTVDVVHSHEEAGVIGPALARIAGVPHVYDMGNDWSVVLGNYGAAEHGTLARLAARTERWVVDRSDVVIAQFPSLATGLRARSFTPVEMALNVPLEPEPSPEEVAQARRRFGAGDKAVVLYTGTLEPYQGLPLLVEAVAHLAARRRQVHLVIAGGDPDQMASLERLAATLGVEDSVDLIGQVPSGQVPAYLCAADVLVSPRCSGTNTPLKIFSYLRAGTPVVATAIEAHTQVIDHDDCHLVAPTASGLAGGIEAAIQGDRRPRGTGAGSAPDRFGIPDHIRAVARAYERVGAAHRGPLDIELAANHIANWCADTDGRRQGEVASFRPNEHVRPAGLSGATTTKKEGT